MMRRGMVEADHAAHQVGARAAAAVAENRVAFVHVHVGKRVDAGRGNPRLAQKAVSPAVRHEREAARLEHAVLDSLYREPATAGRHRVKAQASLERSRQAVTGTSVAAMRVEAGINASRPAWPSWLLASP